MISWSSLTIDFFLQSEGLSPNSYRATRQALSFVEKLSRLSKIAVIGSGTGQQASILHETTHSQIVTIDFITEFAEYRRKEIKKNGLDDRICPVFAFPENLPFGEKELDMIWAESVTAVPDFEYVLNTWNRYLKSGAYIATCSYCWLLENPPETVIEYWQSNGKEIASISERIMQMMQAGFVPLAHFVMPDECWWNYFCPLDENFETFLSRHPDNPEAQSLVDSIEREIDLFEKYGENYGYVFFIGKK